MSFPSEEPVCDADAELNYLKRRVYQEAQAAVRASSTSATLLHVILATAYARRVGEQTRPPSSDTGQGWVDQHRIW